MDKVKEFFDNLAESWTNDNDFKKVNNLLDLCDIKEGYQVLDIGCGKGVITPLLQERTKVLVDAIDLSDNMINEAKKINSDKSKYNFIRGNFTEYDFDKLYDLAIIFNAYPHFLDIEKVVEKANSILKKNGKFIIMHDFKKEELNSHHKAHAMGVSRMLDEALVEANKYSKYFNIVKTIDDDRCYLIILSKKN